MSRAKFKKETLLSSADKEQEIAFVAVYVDEVDKGLSVEKKEEYDVKEISEELKTESEELAKMRQTTRRNSNVKEVRQYDKGREKGLKGLYRLGEAYEACDGIEGHDSGRFVVSIIDERGTLTEISEKPQDEETGVFDYFVETFGDPKNWCHISRIKGEKFFEYMMDQNNAFKNSRSEFLEEEVEKPKGNILEKREIVMDLYHDLNDTIYLSAKRNPDDEELQKLFKRITQITKDFNQSVRTHQTYLGKKKDNDNSGEPEGENSNSPEDNDLGNGRD